MSGEFIQASEEMWQRWAEQLRRDEERLLIMDARYLKNARYIMGKQWLRWDEVYDPDLELDLGL